MSKMTGGAVHKGNGPGFGQGNNVAQLGYGRHADIVDQLEEEAPGTDRKAMGVLTALRPNNPKHDAGGAKFLEVTA